MKVNCVGCGRCHADAWSFKGQPHCLQCACTAINETMGEVMHEQQGEIAMDIDAEGSDVV